MERLNGLVGARASEDLTLVVIHHHPIVVPDLISQLEDYFLSLDETDGRNLIKLCANSGVSAILHGHFHCFSSWSVRTPMGRQMAIIGSPAGTLNIPDTVEEFLELHEADRETSAEVQRGLALYTHRHNTAGTWDEIYTGIFLPL
jgi:hypothetical protein